MTEHNDIHMINNQLQWERDIALSQLSDVGKRLGEHMDDLIHVDEAIEALERLRHPEEDYLYAGEVGAVALDRENEMVDSCIAELRSLQSLNFRSRHMRYTHKEKLYEAARPGMYYLVRFPYGESGDNDVDRLVYIDKTSGKPTESLCTMIDYPADALEEAGRSARDGQIRQIGDWRVLCRMAPIYTGEFLPEEVLLLKTLNEGEAIDYWIEHHPWEFADPDFSERMEMESMRREIVRSVPNQ